MAWKMNRAGAAILLALLLVPLPRAYAQKCSGDPEGIPQMSFSFPQVLQTTSASDFTGAYTPSVATDGSGTWIAVWRSSDSLGGTIGTDYDILYARSTDNGGSWTAPAKLNTTAHSDGSAVDYLPRIATDGKAWVVVWYSNNTLGGKIGTDYDVLYARSTDNGGSWTAPAALNATASSDGSAADYSADIATDGKTWVVAWQSTYNLEGKIGTDYDILYARSETEGSSWTGPATLNINAGSDGSTIDAYPRLAHDGSGHWVAVWSSLLSADYDIRAARSAATDVSKWEAPVYITNSAADSADDYYPTVAHDGGDWVTVWHSTDTLGGTIGTDYDILYARSTNYGASWTAASSLAHYAPGDGASDLDPQVSADGMGNWMANWKSNYNLCAPEPILPCCLGTDLDIMGARSSDGGQTWTAARAVNENAVGDLADDARAHLATDGNGTWVALWHVIDEGGSTASIKSANLVSPKVLSINRSGSNPDKPGSTVSYLVTFSTGVSGVDSSDFSLTVSGGVSGATVASLSGSGSTRTVNVNAGSGTGTLRLNLSDDDSITDTAGNPLGGVGGGNGSRFGQTYTIDDPPAVNAFSRMDPTPTKASSVRYRVYFTEPVSGVDIGDFRAIVNEGLFSGLEISSVAPVPGSGSIYTVTISSSGGTGIVTLRVLDDDTILDVLNHPLGGWGAGNGTVTTSASYSIDRTPPTAGEVSSDSGPYTIDDSELSFTWGGFSDVGTGIEHYEAALGTLDNPEAIFSFEPVGLSQTHTFPGPFEDGTYLCTVRAVDHVDNVGESASAEVTVDTSALLLGQEIPLPEGKTWEQIDWGKTAFLPPDFVVRIDDGPGEVRMLLTADYGVFTIDWFYTTNATSTPDLSRQYGSSSEPVKEAMVLYHTFYDDGTTPTGVPQVDLTSVPDIDPRGNTHVPEGGPGEFGDPGYWLEGKSLHAREVEGFFLLQFNDSQGDFAGFEVVEVRTADFPLVPQGSVHIGSRLHPYDAVPEPALPVVRRGSSATPEDSNVYIYRHAVPNSPQEGVLWAVYENTVSLKMEVVWRRVSGLGGYGIIWPYELRRYTAGWPEGEPAKYQLYVRGDPGGGLGPEVLIPSSLNPEKMPAEKFADPLHHAYLLGGTFHTDGPGWALLKLQTGSTPGRDWAGFEVVRSVLHNDATVFDLSPRAWHIGDEITDTSHEGDRPGYIRVPEGDRYAAGVHGDTGQIFAVNTGALEVWWYNLSRTVDPEGGAFPPWPAERIQWPSKVVRYDPSWPAATVMCAPENDPADACRLIIARQKGSDVIDPLVYGSEWSVYSQPDGELPGYNPNEEHAWSVPFGSGEAIFALRDDLNSPSTSSPYVLMKYRRPADGRWDFRVLEVLREEAPYFFHDWTGFGRPEDPYEGVAGLLIQSPFPLSTLQGCEESTIVPGSSEGYAFEDREGDHWVKAAGSDGGSADITMHYHYPLQPGFFMPGDSPPEGSCVPWLDDGTGTPVDVTYTVSWPGEIPTMKVGDTLIGSKYGLPQINGQCSVEIVYQQSLAREGKKSVILIDPVVAREAELSSLPSDIATERQGTEIVFPDLSLALRRRVSYDEGTGKLIFRGEHVEPLTGFDYVLLNVMSLRERDELLALSSDTSWQTAAESLYQEAKDPVEIHDSSTDPAEVLALTSGYAQGVGYVTLAMQNAEACSPSPIGLEIIEVVPDLERGALLVIEPDCPFDETLTLRHRGDFAGRTDEYEFEWWYTPDEDGTIPEGPYESWSPFTPEPADGLGAVDVTIEGPGLLTLSDNWFVSRYRYTGAGLPWSGIWSEWTPPQLAEGWIKRVMGGIGPFRQRADGSYGGIKGAEDRFASYLDTEVNTVVSMLSQAGEPWAGNVPMSCENLDDFGLIEIYETILNRGIDLSIDGLPPVDYPPANTALLLVASRIADLYMLLANEAYADAADPTIAFGTDDGQYGAEASSIHSFMNMTASLLDEELALLRGRDDTLAPGVQVHPVYNRLIWNFTNDINGGEVAYALNYNIRDPGGEVDGVISEADARALYPQGHGDAWGHYLTALKTYYRLLRHPSYTWNARTEAISVAGQPVTVDYLDERKFAKAAAARARAGAEIVNLSYRQAFVENPAGQWQGYGDPDPERAWGFSEWAGRAGVGSYLDWVVGNAVLPPEDSAHSGIQKIDRTTVLELREVASRFQEIQAQLDTGDVGLNPLGLATNVLPFDISPAEIDGGRTHFEQIYDRAVTAMNNAITVFNHANNSTQLLRRQADSLADFNTTVEEREADFKNRLIEIFGYPFPETIGAGRTFPPGYDGPDIYHYDYVNPSELLGVDASPVMEFPVTLMEIEVEEDGSLSEVPREVVFHISTSADRFGLVKPAEWTGERRAPGEIQLSRSDLLQARARFERAMAEYDNLIASIESQAAQIEAQYALNSEEINVLNAQQNEQEALNDMIAESRARQLQFRAASRLATLVANALAEFLPTAVGTATDATAPARGAIRLAGTVIAELMNQAADQASLAELDHQQAQQMLQSQTNILLTSLRQEAAVQQMLKQLEQTVRQEISLRLELFTTQEMMQQASGRYLAALARGERLLEDRARFRRQTASEVQSRRYKDMAFRVFRNDALQKFRAQFDLAARYVYLAAKAYDFETTFLSQDYRAGEGFLTDIVRERLIGTIQGGLPQTGRGLADPMARMSQNFEVLKGQLGFNNPQKETNRFSLRSELLRIQPGSAGNAVWRETLRRHVVPNLLDLPEFQRYARIFIPHLDSEPGIVIPFESNINFGLNFFGWPLGGGDGAYDSTNFTTKVRSVGVWFSNYNNLGGGMSTTPRVYLIPAGSDVLRSPTGFSGETRPFRIFDQVLPVPFPIGSGDLDDAGWIPGVHTLTDIFGRNRRFSSFRAYHDSGQFSVSEVIRDSRLIGRSVWNTQWMLVIPAGTLHSDREEGLNRFIDGALIGDTRDGNGVSDIKIFFETYAYSGY